MIQDADIDNKGWNEMRRRKKESGVKTVLLVIFAVLFMIMAISVIVIVFGKIHSDYEKLDMTKASEQQTLEVPAVETTHFSV